MVQTIVQTMNDTTDRGCKVFLYKLFDIQNILGPREQICLQVLKCKLKSSALDRQTVKVVTTVFICFN